MKLFPRWLPALAAVWLSACGVAPGPTAPTAIATVDAAIVADGFELAFYRALVQNAYEAPDRLEPVRLLRNALRLYVRTQDDEGRPIDAVTLDLTERILIDSAWIWSGETFGVVHVERGTATRERAPGWITVKWSRNIPAERCGRSTVGIDGGFMELNSTGACSCGSSALVYPRLIRHELGHAFGYYHTDGSSDVMFGHSIPSAGCDVAPSARERLHAKFAHAQAR